MPQTDAHTLMPLWFTPYLRAAALFGAGLMTVLLVLDRAAFSGGLALLSSHAISIFTPLAFAAIIGTRWFERNWQPASLIAGLLILMACVGWSLTAGTTNDYVFAASILLLVDAAVVPWRLRWQIMLTAGAILGFVVAQFGGREDPNLFRQWAELIAAALIAYSAAMVGGRYRAELSRLLEKVRRDSAKAVEVAARELAVGERERADQESRERDELLRVVFATAPEVITLNEMEGGAFIEVGNPSFFGYSRDEVIASNALQIGLWVDPADRAEYVRRLRADGSVHNLEVRLRKKDGAIIPTLISGSLIRLHGKEYMLTFPREISELKRVQEDLEAAREELSAQVDALRESQAQLRTEILEREATQGRLAENQAVLAKVYNAALETMAITRLRDGVLLEVNEEFSRCFGYSRDEAIGRTVIELGLWTKLDQLRTLRRILSETGYARNYEAEGRAKSGSIVSMIMSTVVVEIEGEACVLSLAHDVTEAKKAEREIIAAREAALSASRAKSEFISSMSHEIRTPMNAILGMAELLAEMPLDEEQRRYVETMQNNGNALLELINGILDLAKVESGRLNLEVAEFSLSDMVDKVLATLGPRAYAKQLEVVGQVSPEVPLRLIGDPMRLRQILINLLGNAIKFTERGTVVVSIEMAATPEHTQHPSAGASYRARTGEPERKVELLFTVTDTGIGIPPDKLDELFSPFMQVDSSTARKYGGSGLGLAIVKRLVELMGGTVSVESEIGRGSSFHFSAPFAVPIHADDHPPTIVASSSARRVLVSDSNAANRKVLRELLEVRGAVVVEAADGWRLHEELETPFGAGRAYDLAFLDCRMNGADAFALARELLIPVAGGNGPQCCAVVLMLAPDGLSEGLSRMRKVGLGKPQNCYYLVKPLKTSEILQTIEAVRAPTAAHDEDAKQPIALDNPAAPNAEVPQIRILVADDSPDNRMLVQAYLKPQPFQLDFAENGQIAIDRAKVEPYDLILMDIQMPVVDGYDAVRAIRQWEREQHLSPVRIVALTASALGDAARRSLEVGCDAHLSKPVKKTTLIETILELTSEPNIRTAPACAAAFDKPKERGWGYESGGASGPGLDRSDAWLSRQQTPRRG